MITLKYENDDFVLADIYECSDCDKTFAVGSGETVKSCPYCDKTVDRGI